MTSTDLKREAKKHGGQAVRESSGKYGVWQMEAPPGYLWSASSTHVLRCEWLLGDTAWRDDAIADCLNRMEEGITECHDDDCEYCHPARGPK